MRNEGIQRVWVIATFFNNSIMCVQGSYEATPPQDWMDAFFKLDKLFSSNPKLTYDEAFHELTALAPDLGIEISLGKSLDSSLQKVS